MNFEDIKEKVLARLQAIWEEFQESKLYTTLRDRYETLNAIQQRIVLAGVGAIGALILLSFPFGYLSQSSDYITEFSDKRQLIRDLLKVSREASELPAIPPSPSIEMIRASVERDLQNARLLPEQMRGSSQISEASSLIPQNLMAGGLMVNLSKLNLRQIVDLGYQFQQISPSVKLKDLSLVANPEDPRYFDVVFKLTALNVPTGGQEMSDSEPGPVDSNDGESAVAPDVEPEMAEPSGDSEAPAMNIPKTRSGKKTRQVR